MTRQFSPTQSLARDILQGAFLGYDVSKKNNWKFAIRRSYFYAPTNRLEGFVANIEKTLQEVPGVKVLSTDDNYAVWPQLSYYEAIVLVEDTEAFFQGPAPKEELVEEAAPEAVEEPAAPELDLLDLFQLPNSFQDRKTWRRTIRNLAQFHLASYTNENGCYYLVMPEGQTYEFALTEDFRPTIVRLPDTCKVL